MQNNNISYFLQLLYTKLELQYNKFNEFMQMFLVYKEVQNNANDCVKRMSSLISKYEHLFTVLQQYSDIIDYKFNDIEKNIDEKFEQMNETINNTLEQTKNEVEQTIKDYTTEANQSIDTKFEDIEQDISDYKQTIDGDLVTINKSIDGIGGSIVTINESIDGINEKIDEINTTIEGIDTSIGDINSDLGTINTALDTKADENHNHDDRYVLKTNIIELIYPVGSIYMSMINRNPGAFIGGTWKQITDRFLYATNTDIGKTGGSETAVLTVDNLPPHKHSYNRDNLTNDISIAGGSSGIIVSPTQLTSTTQEETTSVGKGKAFPIIPPYIAVYCWQRTA